MRRLLAGILTISLLCGCAASPGAAATAGTNDNITASAAANDEKTTADGPVTAEISEVDLPQSGWQTQAAFPDWKGYTDDTLAMNSMFTFYGYHEQGELYVTVSGEVESFRLYLNGKPIDTQKMTAGGTYKIDISALTQRA